MSTQHMSFLNISSNDTCEFDTGFDFSSCPEWSACRSHPVYSLWRQASQNVSLISKLWNGSISVLQTAVLFIIYLSKTGSALLLFCDFPHPFASLQRWRVATLLSY